MIANPSRGPRHWLRASLCLGGSLLFAASLIAQEPIAVVPTSPTGAPVQPTLPPQSFSQLDPQPVTHQVSSASDRIQMIVNTSRILTQESKIPQAQVNNPDVVGLTALSPNQVQIYGRRAGVTQVNIWDEKGNIRTIDVMVHGDAQELARLLHDTFPKAALRIRPISTGVIISGYVDDPNQQSRIVEISQNYYPNVINYITVGGVQQVLLQVRVMEVSRTKLRNLGVDLAAILENGSAFGSGAAGILTTGALSAGNTIATSGRATIPIRIANNGDNFYAFIEALKQNNLAKILADPNLVTESGRPAFMNAGGEFPILVPQSLGTISIEYRRFGTQIDFVPIVMGNNTIRLEVRPRISEIDESRSVTINGQQVPGLNVREADVAVTLRAGQTLAIAGLVQTRVSSTTRGIPVIMDTPVIGSLFRRTSDQINEIELLIMVTPQIVDGIDPQQICDLVGGPGSQTTNPNDTQLFTRGHIEVDPDDCFRPPHFQQPYPAQPRAPSAGEDMPVPGAPTGELLQAPLDDEPTPPTPVPPQPVKSGATAPAVPSAPTAVPAVRPAPFPGSQSSDEDTNSAPRTSAAPVSQRREVSPLDETIIVRGDTRAPATAAAPASAPAAPSNSSEPGLIGPVGYDTSK